MALVEVPQPKLFGKWSFDNITVKDDSLSDYIAVRPQHAQYLPHSSGRHNVKRFRKANLPIVERLVNSLMMHGRNNGKKLMAVRIIKHAFEVIYIMSKTNPIQVLADAVCNGGPREDSTRIGTAGVVRRQAVDVSPIRRVNTAIYLICMGAREASFRNMKTLAECLADEISHHHNASTRIRQACPLQKKKDLQNQI